MAACPSKRAFAIFSNAYCLTTAVTSRAGLLPACGVSAACAGVSTVTSAIDRPTTRGVPTANAKHPPSHLELAASIKAASDLKQLEDIWRRNSRGEERLVPFMLLSRLSSLRASWAGDASFHKLVLAAARDAADAIASASTASGSPLSDGHFLANALHSASLLLAPSTTPLQSAGPPAVAPASHSTAEVRANLARLVTVGLQSFLGAARKRQASGAGFVDDLEVGALELSRWSTSASRALGALSNTAVATRGLAPISALAKPGDVQRLTMACLDSCAAALDRCRRHSRESELAASATSGKDEHDIERAELAASIRAQCFSDLTLVVESLRRLLALGAREDPLSALLLISSSAPAHPPASQAVKLRLLREISKELLSAGLLPSLPGASFEALSKAANAAVALEGSRQGLRSQLMARAKPGEVDKAKDQEEEDAHQEALSLLLSGVANEATVRLQSACGHAPVSSSPSPACPVAIRPEALVSMLDLFSSTLGSGRRREKRGSRVMPAPTPAELHSSSVRAPQLFSAVAGYLMLPSHPQDSSTILSSLPSPLLARVARSFASSRFVEWENASIPTLWSALAVTIARRLTDDLKVMKLASASTSTSSEGLSFPEPGLVSHVLASFTRASVRAPALVSLALLHLEGLAAVDGGSGLLLTRQQAVALLWCCALQGVYQPSRVLERLVLPLAMDGVAGAGHRSRMIEGKAESRAEEAPSTPLDEGSLAQLNAALVGLSVEGPAGLRGAFSSLFSTGELTTLADAYRRQESKTAPTSLQHARASNEVAGTLEEITKQLAQKRLRLTTLQQVAAAEQARSQDSAAKRGRQRRPVKRGKEDTLPAHASGEVAVVEPSAAPSPSTTPGAAASSEAWTITKQAHIAVSNGLSLSVEFLINRPPSTPADESARAKGVAVLLLHTADFVRSRLLPLGTATGAIKTSLGPGAGEQGRALLAGRGRDQASIAAGAGNTLAQRSSSAAAAVAALLPGGLSFPGNGNAERPAPTDGATSVKLGLRRALIADAVAAATADEMEGGHPGFGGRPDGAVDDNERGPAPSLRHPAASSSSLLEAFSSSLPSLTLSTQAKVRWLQLSGYEVITIATHLEWPSASSSLSSSSTAMEEQVEWLWEEKGLRQAFEKALAARD